MKETVEQTNVAQLKKNDWGWYQGNIYCPGCCDELSVSDHCLGSWPQCSCGYEWRLEIEIKAVGEYQETIVGGAS